MQTSLFPQLELEYQKHYKVIAVLGHWRISCCGEQYWVSDYWKRVRID